MIKITSDMAELQSMNITEDNISKLKSLFPEAFNEGSIDFDVLKQLLGENVDEKEERYGLNWHGKRQARQLALTPSRGTLRPCKAESVDWDNTQNIMIEGDNLEVLKLLQKSYAGKVKLIYIDPPYNTGKDFVYPDNFQDNIKNYLEITGQTEEGSRRSTNTETSGRYHTDWLNMMYPRLKLAKNLLRKDGVIAVNVDDIESDNVKKMCSEIFGEENFIANIVWQSKDTPGNDSISIAQTHNHLFLYHNGQLSLNLLDRNEKQLSNYKNPDNDPRGVWLATPLTRSEFRERDYYPLINPMGKSIYPPDGTCWRRPKDILSELQEEDRIWWGKSGDSNFPMEKKFLSETKSGVVNQTWWPYDFAGSTRNANAEIKSLFDGVKVFDTPKPTKLIVRLISMITNKDSLVMDFFAGSGTTGHAVYLKNKEDGGNRNYILIQLPEMISPDNKEQKTLAEFCTNNGLNLKISELTKERLRRAGKKVREDNPEWNGDVGFRVFKLDTSNIRPWEASAETLSQQLDAYVNPILEGRSEEDLLTELMLKRGIDLSVNVETRQFDGLTVSCVDGGKLFTCFTSQISASSVEELTKGILDWHKSLKAGKDTVCYFLDDAFENNVAKTNLCAILEQHGLTNLHSL
ncbi:site-specific DNA-methyltransferase [Raoultella ornithinolytica]|uniref:site-specific DNA-methyltransferase n=1 Tax=Raoultella ornithinolytica TaxID=54291 RepID=UPI002A5A6042|nr:site-specific DNA-methyltransferase [Raoultella ornithinolytica]WPO22177.1 site-specific DNA-methyltransferase [Raoultella ornithinolytica]